MGAAVHENSDPPKSTSLFRTLYPTMYYRNNDYMRIMPHNAYDFVSAAIIKS